MPIRNARADDESGIARLLKELDYPGTESFLKDKIHLIIHHPSSRLIVYEKAQQVIAFMAIDIIVQLGLKGDFARISYFAVDSLYRGHGIGNEMENYCVSYAKEMNCERVEVHCHERRTATHEFYIRQGYEEAPKYFIKELNKVH